MNRISRRKLIKFVVASQAAGFAGAMLRAPGLAFGVADMRQSKSVTGAAIMQRVEAGKKDIPKTVYAYIP